MALQFGVFDHIEPQDGLTLKQSYDLRLTQIEKLDKAGFYAYHLAEHHRHKMFFWPPYPNARHICALDPVCTYCPCTTRYD